MADECSEKEMVIVSLILQIFIECLLGIFPREKREATKSNCDLYSV